MNTHRYAVGERVLYTQQRFPHLTWKAPYMVVRCLASRSVEPQYQIRSAHEAADRAAGEHELSRIGLPLRTFRSPEIPCPLDYFSTDDAANLNLIPAADLPRRAWHKNESASAAHG
jgi:hypothetical protein